MKRLAPIIDRFIPANISRDDMDAFGRARLIIAFSCAVAIWGPFFILIHHAVLESPTGAALVAVATVLVAAIPLILRRTGSLWLAGNLLSFHLCWLLVLLTAMFGGHRAPPLLWLVAVPVLATFLVGIRTGLTWTVICFLAIAGFYGLDHHGFQGMHQLTERHEDFFHAVVLASLLLLFVSLAILFETIRHRILRMLEQRNRALVEANRALRGEIAERRKAQELQARLTDILNNTTDFVGTATTDGRILYINPAGRRMLGLEPDEDVSGMSILECHPPSVHQRMIEHTLPVTLRDGVLNGECLLLARDGREIPVSQAAIAHKSPDGAATYLSTIMRDITERKQVEAELRRAKEQAEAASRAKSQFLANMSHEIRTPMNGVLGMAELMFDTELTREQREYVEIIQESGQALLNLLNDILDFSRIEAGRLELDPVPFSLRGCLRDTVRSQSILAHEKGLELLLDIPAEVPDALVGDPTRLRQVVVNLVGNAVKFTERGEVVVSVSVVTSAGREQVLRFNVSDTGIGIPPEKRAKVFEAFMQADGSTTRRFGGSGLGLAICAQLVELMGGEIGVDANTPQGSIFHFTSRFGVQAARTSPALPRTPADLAGMRVLIVDDNATNRRILHDLVLRWHMRPALVDHGAAALDRLREARASKAPFQLVLLDAMMPGMDGFTVAERIRDDPDVVGPTVMMLSSGGRPGDARRCRELRVAAYLTKPVTQSDLLDAILTVLGCRPPEAEEADESLVTRHSLRERRRPLSILLAEDNAVNCRLAVRLLEKMPPQQNLWASTGSGSLPRA